MTSFVTWGALTLLALPVVRPSRRRPLLVCALVTCLVVTGLGLLGTGPAGRVADECR